MPPEFLVHTVDNEAYQNARDALVNLSGIEIKEIEQKVNHQDLALRVKIAISPYDDMVTVYDLMDYRWKPSENRKPPEGWLDFAKTLSNQEKRSLTAAFVRASYIVNGRPDLGNLRKHNWEKSGAKLLKSIFS